MESSRPLVAVVDDEESVRCALARLLRASGFDAECFASGEAFLGSLAGRRPDCVVLDLQMGGMSGRDVQRQLIGLPTSVPLIIITAHDEPRIREQSLADGAAAYLRKPLRGEALIRSVHQAIGGAGARYDQGPMRAPGQ
jgi:FixJ family two-component response regulator